MANEKDESTTPNNHPESNSNKQPTAKETAPGCLILIVIIALCAWGLNSCWRHEPKEAAKQTASTSTQKESTNSKEQQELFTAWEKEFMSNGGQFDEVWNSFKIVSKDIENNQLDIIGAYGTINKLKDSLSVIKSNFYNISIPKELEEKHKKTLKEANDNMILATAAREKALAYILDYFDTKKPSSMSNAIDEARSSDAYIINAMALMTGVKMDLKLIKENPNNK